MKIRFHDPDLNVTNLSVRFLRDGKVILKLGQSNFHYTFHPGQNTGIADIHESDERIPENDPRRHRTLGTLARSVIEQEIRALDLRMIVEFVKLWRPLQLGWMIRRRIGISSRLPIGSETAKVDGISIKQGLGECTEPLATWIRPPEFYDEILDNPDAAYILVDCAKRSSAPYAAMLTYKGRHGFVQMRWAKFSDIRRWSTRWEPIIVAALSRLLEASDGSADSKFQLV